MPRIVTSQDIRQTGTGALRTSAPQLPVDTEVYQGVSDVANQVFNREIQIRDKEEETEAKRLDVEFSSAVRDVLTGTPENPGYYYQKGEEAVKNRTSVSARINALREEYKGKASSDRVRTMLDGALTARTEQAHNKISIQAVEQSKVAASAVSIAREDEAVQDAIAAYNDPKIVGQSVATAKAEAAKRAQENGFPPEVIQNEMEKAATKVHLGVITAMAEHDAQGAKDYFNQNRADIDGTSQPAIDKMLKSAGLNQQSQQETDVIMSSGLDLQNALSQARNISNPELRDEVVRRVKVRFAENNAIKATDEKALEDEAWRLIVQDGKKVSELPVKYLTVLAGPKLDSMQRYEDSRAKGQQGFARISKPGTKTKYLAMTDDEVLQKHPDQLRQDVTQSDWNAILKRYETAEKNVKTLKENPGVEKSIDDLIKFYAPKQWNYGLAKATDEYRAIGRSAQTELMEFVRETIDTKNRLPTDLELRKKTAQSVLQIEFDAPTFSTSFDKTGSFEELKDIDMSEYEVEPADIVAVTGIPEKFIEQVKDFVVKSKQPLTLQNMIIAYEGAERG